MQITAVQPSWMATASLLLLCGSSVHCIMVTFTNVASAQFWHPGFRGNDDRRRRRRSTFWQEMCERSRPIICPKWL